MVIRVRSKNRLAVIAALDNVQRLIGQIEARKASHHSSLRGLMAEGYQIKSSLTLFIFFLFIFFTQIASNAGLCGALKWNFPAGEYEYGGMALESTGKDLRTLNT